MPIGNPFFYFNYSSLPYLAFLRVHKTMHIIPTNTPFLYTAAILYIPTCSCSYLYSPNQKSPPPTSAIQPIHTV